MKHFCQKASQLASDAFERNLTFWERLKLRLHLSICGMCRHYADNLKLLNKILFGMHHQQKDDDICLSDEDRKRIETALKQSTTHSEH